jgi:hypothetical protein
MSKEPIVETRKLNNFVLLEDFCKLMSIAFIFVVISKVSMMTEISEIYALRVIGAIGMIGYLILSGRRLIERSDQKYWKYSNIKESK